MSDAVTSAFALLWYVLLLSLKVAREDCIFRLHLPFVNQFIECNVLEHVHNINIYVRVLALYMCIVHLLPCKPFYCL